MCQMKLVRSEAMEKLVLLTLIYSLGLGPDNVIAKHVDPVKSTNISGATNETVKLPQDGTTAESLFDHESTSPVTLSNDTTELSKLAGNESTKKAALFNNGTETITADDILRNETLFNTQPQAILLEYERAYAELYGDEALAKIEAQLKFLKDAELSENITPDNETESATLSNQDLTERVTLSNGETESITLLGEKFESTTLPNS